MTIVPVDRWVRFGSLFNFRDLGGIATASGQTVRRGRVFRSDDLGRLQADDRSSFLALGIRTVIDLRRESEVRSLGRVPEWTGVSWHHHHLRHELWDHGTYDPATGVARWLADRYGELLATGAADIARVIALLSATREPAVVHCVAGKDRTGLISALTLSLVGVDDEEIAHDYALTEQSGSAYQEWLRRTNPAEAAKVPPPYYVQTPREAMLMTLAELRARYGTVHDYLGRHGLTQSHVDELRRGLISPS